MLFADLTGSMELLADRDPEEARAILDPVLGHMMDAVHAYEGTVNQVMGDGIMALFGAPIAQEDHAVRACYAALALQTAIRKYSDEMRVSHGVTIMVRVGINSGDVLVRSISSDLKMDYSAIGQTTHLASRMEQLASGGSILIAPDTLSLVEGLVQVRALGHVPVKGLPDPVETFELTGALTRRSRLQARAASGGLTRFIGRQREFDVLIEAAKNARQGKGQAVAIVGEAGVGKSRLFWEFIHSHHNQGSLVVEASSLSYGKATSYLPVIDLLKVYFEIGDRDDTRSVKEKVTGKLLTLDRRLEPLLHPLLGLLDQPVEDEQWNQLDPPQKKRQTLEALKQLWLREAKNQPLVLVFEDLHWIDSETQEFLNELLDGISATQILLLFNYRPEYQHIWGSKSFYTQLRLDALPVESVEEFLANLLGTAPGLESLKKMLIKRGNPLFLEESIRNLVETGTLVGERSAYQLTRAVDTLDIPASVQAMLAARIDRLEAYDKRLLQTAAVIGRDVLLKLLKSVFDLHESQLTAALARLQAAEFIYEAGLYPDLEYTFKHALTHDVTYGGVTDDRKHTLHARIVEAIETANANRIEEHTERLAHHALRGGVWDKAVRYARQAGQRAFARSANAEAAKWWEQALEAIDHLPDGQDKTELAIDTRLQLRGVFLLTGLLDRATDLTKQAQKLASDAGDRYRLARALAAEVHIHYLVCKFDAVQAAAERALEIADQDGFTDIQVNARAALPVVIMGQQSFPEAEKMWRSNLELLSKLGDGERFGLPALPSVYGRAIYALWLCWTGCCQETRSLLEEATTIALRVAEPRDEAFKCFCACGALDALGDFPRAIREGERGIEIYRAIESRPYYAWTGLGLGHAYTYSGRTQEGIEMLEDCLEHFRSSGPPLGLLHGPALLADAWFHAGDIGRALAIVDEATQFEQDVGVSIRQPMFLELLGRIHSHPEHLNPQKSKDYFADAMKAAEQNGYRVVMTHCHAGLGRLKLATGQISQAKEKLNLACDMYRDMGMTYYLHKAEEDLAGLA